MSFEAWQCNSPTEFSNSTRIRASYYSEGCCHDRILVLSQTRSTSAKENFETWTYRIETNSWEVMPSRNRKSPPEVRVGSILVTICQTKVLYLTPGVETVPTVWMFDGDKKIWSRKSLIGDIAPVVNESAMFFVLLDRNSSSSSPCECRYAVVGISAVKKVWILRCDDTKRKYVWKRIEARQSTLQARSLAKGDIYPLNLTIFYRSCSYSTGFGAGDGT